MTIKQQSMTSVTRTRLCVRAVVAGAILELVAIGLFLMLAGGLGLWSMGAASAGRVSQLGAGLALFAGAAWVTAAFLGGYVATVIARASTPRDGLLHGLMSWAIACATAAVVACTWFMAAISVGLAKVDLVSAMDGRLMIGFFVGDLLALTGAVAGGIVAARAEARLSVQAQPELSGAINTLVPAPAR